MCKQCFKWIEMNETYHVDSFPLKNEMYQFLLYSAKKFTSQNSYLSQKANLQCSVL